MQRFNNIIGASLGAAEHPCRLSPLCPTLKLLVPSLGNVPGMLVELAPTVEPASCRRERLLTRRRLVPGEAHRFNIYPYERGLDPV